MRERHLPPGNVTDKTPDLLLAYGWKPVGGTASPVSMWIDPRTGEVWTISQAAAIQEDRSPQKYRFDGRR